MSKNWLKEELQQAVDDYNTLPEWLRELFEAED